jgi:hypothetical protein
MATPDAAVRANLPPAQSEHASQRTGIGCLKPDSRRILTLEVSLNERGASARDTLHAVALPTAPLCTRYYFECGRSA